MEPRRPTSVRSRLAVVVALVAMVAAGCGGSGPVGRGPAATVNGTDISQAEVEAMVEAQHDLIELSEASAREQLEAGTASFTEAELEAALAEQLARFPGDGAHTMSTEVASEQLSSLVQLNVLQHVLAEEGGEVTDAHREQARTDLTASLSQGGLDAATVPSTILDHYVELEAVNAALEEIVPAEAGAELGMSPDEYEQVLRELYERSGPSYLQVCLRGVLTEDEASADEAHDRLADGEDLAEVGADLGVDGPEAEAFLGECQDVPAGTLVEYVGEDAFEAEAGQVFEPVEPVVASPDDPGYWMVLVVEGTYEPTFEELRDQLAAENPDTTEAERSAARQAYVDEIVMEGFEEADVWVDPRFGTWDAPTGSVVPPEDPAAPEVDAATDQFVTVDGAGEVPAP